MSEMRQRSFAHSVKPLMCRAGAACCRGMRLRKAPSGSQRADRRPAWPEVRSYGRIGRRSYCGENDLEAGSQTSRALTEPALATIDA